MSNCKINSLGDTEWYVDGRYHREDGPAYEGANGVKVWWVHGQQHRLDGPAIDCQYGNGYWFINNISLPIRDVNTWMEEQNITWPFDEPTQMLFLMKFG